MAEDSLRVFCSVYGYNDSVTPDTETNGMSYEQIYASYLDTDFAKDEMGDLNSTTSSTSSAALSDSEQNYAYSGASYSEAGSSGASTSSSYAGTEDSKSPNPLSPQRLGDNAELLYDGPMYSSDYVSKTFAQLKKLDLRSGASAEERYEEGPILGGAYEDDTEPTKKPRGETVNDGYEGAYITQGDGYERSKGEKKGTQSAYYEASYSEQGSSPRTSSTGDYETYPEGYSQGSLGGTYARPHDSVSPRDGLKSASGVGEGFGGLNQTQTRLLREVKRNPALRASSSSKASAKPLYEESMAIDFFKSFGWNERWQSVLERPTMTPEEVRQRSEDIEELTSQFLHVARPIVTKIVEELHLPDSEKTIKPVDVGGVAGGEKFMAKQLFMKYARDNIRLRLYDGDSWAQKAALHELKSLNALIACNIPNLHFPLMACISCYGHCVVVVSKLPLSKKTLCYGSDDIAKTIHTDREVGALFRQASEILNLEPHYVTEGKTRLEKLMYGPVDIEGHKGLDGRSYIVDTARLFPPAPPVRGIRGCHLYKLLRKELVRTHPVPLSSDAFSFFGKINETHHNVPVADAVNRIFDEIIPNLFEHPQINDLLANGDITKEIHDRGINVRFLGCILDYALSMNERHGFQFITQEAINGIVREMIARASKHVFFASMRSDVRASLPMKQECRRLASHHWNHLLFAQSIYSTSVSLQQDPTETHLTRENVETWWATVLMPAIKKRFVFFNGNGRWIVPQLSELEEAANRVMTQQVFLDALLADPARIFWRSIQITGVVFNQPMCDAIAAQGNLWFSENKKMLSDDDIADIVALDKRVTFVPFLDMKGGAGSFADAEKFYLAEIANRTRALGPTHPQVAISHRHLGELYSDQAGCEEKARVCYANAAQIIRAYHQKNPAALVRDLSEIYHLEADLYVKYDRHQLAQRKLEELLELYKPEGENNPNFNQISSNSTPLPSSSSDIGDSPTSHLNFVKSIQNMVELEDAANVLDKLAFVKIKLGLYAEASSIYELAYQSKMKVFGDENSWQVARTLNGHAQLLFAQGKLKEAKEMCLKVKKVTIETRGPTHSEVGIALDNLARVTSAEGNFDEADDMLKLALDIKINSLGERHSFVAMSWDHMASNRFQRMIHLLSASQSATETLNAENTSSSSNLENGASNGVESNSPFFATASTFNKADLHDIALLYERALETIEKSLGRVHSAYGISALNLAVTRAYLWQWKEALSLAREARSVLASTMANNHPTLVIADSNLQFISDIANLSEEAQKNVKIPRDALKRVYHTSHTSTSSSTNMPSGLTSASGRSRISEKIRLLLEKKGLAVTEENAEKVTELLRRRKAEQQQQQQPSQGAAYAVMSNNDYENAPMSRPAPPTPAVERAPIFTRPPKPTVRARHVDSYENVDEGATVPETEPYNATPGEGQSYYVIGGGHEEEPHSDVPVVFPEDPIAPISKPIDLNDEEEDETKEFLVEGGREESKPEPQQSPHSEEIQQLTAQLQELSNEAKKMNERIEHTQESMEETRTDKIKSEDNDLDSQREQTHLERNLGSSSSKKLRSSRSQKSFGEVVGGWFSSLFGPSKKSPATKSFAKNAESSKDSPPTFHDSPSHGSAYIAAPGSSVETDRSRAYDDDDNASPASPQSHVPTSTSSSSPRGSTLQQKQLAQSTADTSSPKKGAMPISSGRAVSGAVSGTLPPSKAAEYSRRLTASSSGAPNAKSGSSVAASAEAESRQDSRLRRKESGDAKYDKSGLKRQKDKEVKKKKKLEAAVVVEATSAPSSPGGGGGGGGSPLPPQQGAPARPTSTKDKDALSAKKGEERSAQRPKDEDALPYFLPPASPADSKDSFIIESDGSSSSSSESMFKESEKNIERRSSRASIPSTPAAPAASAAMPSPPPPLPSEPINQFIAPRCRLGGVTPGYGGALSFSSSSFAIPPPAPAPIVSPAPPTPIVSPAPPVPIVTPAPRPTIVPMPSPAPPAPAPEPYPSLPTPTSDSSRLPYMATNQPYGHQPYGQSTGMKLGAAPPHHVMQSALAPPPPQPAPSPPVQHVAPAPPAGAGHHSESDSDNDDDEDDEESAMRHFAMNTTTRDYYQSEPAKPKKFEALSMKKPAKPSKEEKERQKKEEKEMKKKDKQTKAAGKAMPPAQPPAQAPSKNFSMSSSSLASSGASSSEAPSPSPSSSSSSISSKRAHAESKPHLSKGSYWQHADTKADDVNEEAVDKILRQQNFSKPKTSRHPPQPQQQQAQQMSFTQNMPHHQVQQVQQAHTPQQVLQQQQMLQTHQIDPILALDDADLDDLDDLDLDELQASSSAVPAPHKGPSWGWGAF